MHIILGIFLITQGIADLVGFITYWKIASIEDMLYKTTLLSGFLDVGDVGIRIVGILWLLTGLAFAMVGVGIVALQPWWFPLILYITIFSLIMCILGWPDARFGVLVNIIILASSHRTVFKNSEWKLSERNEVQSKSTSVSVLRLRKLRSGSSLQPFLPKCPVDSPGIINFRK